VTRGAPRRIKPVIRAQDAWATVLSLFGTPERPRTCDGEPMWLGSRGQRSFDVRMPISPKFLLLCPKSSPFQWWWADPRLPRDVGFICTPWLADAGSASVLAPLYRLARRAVFVGDLHPIALALYVEARRVAIGMNGPLLQYGGVNDAWLAAMSRSLKARWDVASLRIRLSRPENALLKRLDNAIDLEQLVGSEACSILRGGYKVEIEGAMNPALYRAGHGRWVFQHLRSVARANHLSQEPGTRAVERHLQLEMVRRRRITVALALAARGACGGSGAARGAGASHRCPA
jgi:hypothetical protein